ncbi:hypothetical protein HaLaN_00120, partial [Haematococcus lacustris]
MMKTLKLLCAVMSIYVPNARNVKSKGKFKARSISLRITNLQRAIIFEHSRLNRFTSRLNRFISGGEQA